MAIKRKCDDKPVIRSADSLRKLLFTAIASHESAEIAVLHIMKSHDFYLNVLQQILKDDAIDISFSNVKYGDIANFVGLNPHFNMTDIKTFILHRSRIPTAVFKSIVEDMDLMLIQYGPLFEHRSEAARSRFLAPIFNRLIAVFEFAFRNVPEPITEDRVTTKDRVVYHFKSCGSIGVLFIEVKPKIGNESEHLDAVAQVIAECEACDWNNAVYGERIPVHGILCDGEAFRFFSFDGSTEPYSFQRGLGPNHPPTIRRPFRLPDPKDMPTTRPFILALRPICEIIFDLLLSGYASSLETHQKDSKNRVKWEEAMESAVNASKSFREAETKRQAQLVNEADSIIDVAMTSLKRSINAIPTLYKPELIMTGWDDDEIGKV